MSLENSRSITIIPTGAANLASIFAALARLGVTPLLAESPRDIAAATAVILPGVGAFTPAINSLQQRKFITPLIDRLASGAPTLAICLGMHILCSSSEEAPGVPGLGFIPARVTRFPSTVRAPQMGWNTITPAAGCEILESGDAYFANSYRLINPPIGWSVAMADHAGKFIAACELGSILACQFHPELSSTWGRSLLSRWLRRSNIPTESIPC